MKYLPEEEHMYEYQMNQSITEVGGHLALWLNPLEYLSAVLF